MAKRRRGKDGRYLPDSSSIPPEPPQETITTPVDTQPDSGPIPTQQPLDTTNQTSEATTTASITTNAAVGGVTLPTISDDGASELLTHEGWAQASRRWDKEGTRGAADAFRSQVRDTCRKSGMEPGEIRAHSWQETIKAFPPMTPQNDDKSAIGPFLPKAGDDGGQMQGLKDIPKSWPDLPDTASLPAELGWVQSQRLRIVEEQSSGATRIHLDRARTPAPSWAALGWLETSIRSYAKYVDVVAKAMGAAVDEQEHVQRERMAIDEIRGLLAEMHRN